GIRRGVLQRRRPYAAGRRAFRDRVIDELYRQAETTQMSVTRGDVQRAVREKEPDRVLEAAWPRLEAGRAVVELLTDGRAMARAADGVFTREEQGRLMWDGRITRARAPWSAADLV